MEFAEETDLQSRGPFDLGRVVSFGPNGPKRSGDREARDCHKMAPCRVQIVLAVEVAAPWWPTNCTAGDPQAYPRDEHCQSAVGSAADPWRVAQARRRYRTDQRSQVHGQATRSAVPRLDRRRA